MPTTTTLTARFQRSYGAHPAHLVLLLAGLALAVHTVRTLGLDALWDPEVWWQSIAVWFIGAAIAHDLLLYPAIAAADTVITRVTSRRPPRPTTRVPAVNYVRVPLMACGLVTLLFLPGIIRQGADTYERATGQTQDPFLLRWVLLCSAFLLLGLAAYLVARVRAPRRTSPSTSPRAQGAAPPPAPAATSAPTADITGSGADTGVGGQDPEPVAPRAMASTAGDLIGSDRSRVLVVSVLAALAALGAVLLVVRRRSGRARRPGRRRRA